MRFRIVGADKHSGEAINTIIEAADKFHAMREAQQGGVLVSEVIEVQDAPIQRVFPTIIQSPVQTGPVDPPAPMQGRQVVYVIERQVQVPAPAQPAQVVAPPQVVMVPATPPSPPPPQIITHVHVSNNSSSSSLARAPSRSSGGCLSAIAKLAIFAVAVVVAVILISKWLDKKNPLAPTSPSPSRSTSSPSKRTPHSEIKRESARVEPPKPSSPALGDAERACLDALRQRADYIALKNKVDEYAAKVKAARDDPRHPSLPALSEQWMDAKNRLSKMEADALANDPAVQAAKRQK